MKRVLYLTAVTVLLLAIALPASAKGPKDKAPKVDNIRVWICHYPGHENPVGDSAHKHVDGDYLVHYHPHMETGEPHPKQVKWCADNGGGELIEVSSRALKGHGVQLLERLSTYPDYDG